MIDEIIKSKKYSKISKDTINRTINKIKSEYPKIKDKEIIKKVKEELYKTHTAYFKNIDYKIMLSELKTDSSITMHEKWLRKYDNNRLASLEGFYEEIFKITGKPRILIDVACGLNPLTLPWMKLDKNTKYYCYDLEQNLIDFLNGYFTNKNHKAFLLDVVSNPPSVKADVAFIFKASTCFEWQKPGNTLKVLEGLNCKYAVISLMMRGKYNLEGCRNYFKNLLQNKYTGTELVLKKEYLFIIKF